MKFADDTKVFGLITNNKTACRKEDDDLAAWCSNHNLALEILVDYPPLNKGDKGVERVINLKFLGLTVTKPLYPTHNNPELCFNSKFTESPIYLFTDYLYLCLIFCLHHF